MSNGLSIIDVVRTESEQWHKVDAPPGAWLLLDFLLRNGKVHRAQPLPSKWKRSMPKRCFTNAWNLTSRATGLRYCEGLAMPSKVLGWTFHHGWAIDNEGRVADPTLTDPENYQFLGIEISATERTRFRAVEAASVLDTMRGHNTDFISWRDHELMLQAQEWVRAHRNTDRSTP